MLTDHRPLPGLRNSAFTTPAGVANTPAAMTKTVTPLWTVRKDAQRIDAQLLDVGPAGWELQMSRNHVWMSGRRFADRPNAIAHGEAIRRDLNQRDWRG